MPEEDITGQDSLRKWNRKAWALILGSGVAGAALFAGALVSGQGMSVGEALLPIVLGLSFGVLVAAVSIKTAKDHFVPDLEWVPPGWKKRICRVHPEAARLSKPDFRQVFWATQKTVGRDSSNKAFNAIVFALIAVLLLVGPVLIRGMGVGPMMRAQENMDRVAAMMPADAPRDQMQVFKATEWDRFCYNAVDWLFWIGCGIYAVLFVIAGLSVRHEFREIPAQFMEVARSMGITAEDGAP